jgi:hypothetical protein
MSGIREKIMERSKDKVAIVTGGARGVGAATARLIVLERQEWQNPGHAIAA